MYNIILVVKVVYHRPHSDDAPIVNPSDRIRHTLERKRDGRSFAALTHDDAHLPAVGHGPYGDHQTSQLTALIANASMYLHIAALLNYLICFRICVLI